MSLCVRTCGSGWEEFKLNEDLPNTLLLPSLSSKTRYFFLIKKLLFQTHSDIKQYFAGGALSRFVGSVGGCGVFFVRMFTGKVNSFP